MLLTIVLSLVMMLGLFLLLWSEVGFIQDKRFASSSPKEELAVVPDTKPERFKGQHAVGWTMAVLSLVILVEAIVVAAWDGIRNGFSFGSFFVRFIVMLLLLKCFDIGFFDWFLLCNQGFNFFGHYYPEVKPVLGPYLFGYNKKSHMIQVLLFIVFSALLAWICTLL